MDSWSRIPPFTYKRWRNHGESGDHSDEDDTNNEIRVTTSARVDPEEIKSASRTGSHKTEETFTVDDALEAFGFGKFQWKMAVLTGLAWVVFAGTSVGSAVIGNVSDIYGRKAGLKISMIWILFYGLLSAFAPVYGWLLFLRGLVGFGLGGTPQSVTLYSEFLPVKSRGFCVLLIAVFWSLGSVFAVLLALVTMPTLGWRWLLGFSTIPIAIAICFLSWLPESARFHVLTGKTDKAMATLARIAKENGKAMPQGKLIVYKQAGHGQIKTLFTSRYWRTTLLTWFIWFVNAFSYYGIVLLTSELYQAGHSCETTQGGKVEPSCTLECKSLTIADYKDLFWTSTAEFPGLLGILLVIDRIGRKKTLALCFFAFSLSLLPMYACIGRTAVTICMFIARGFISGGYQVGFVYTSEVFPTEIRALAMGTSSAMSNVGALITPFVAQVLLRTSVYGTLSFYCGFSLLGCIASLILPIETLGKSLQESSLDKDSGDEMTTRTRKSNDTAEECEPNVSHSG
ncbi:synaptic vesicle 2-related protein isoform X2 [Pseudoliparis swirei]|uniref:synaptic vesicle 2-related protein isoform X2 n=1 Tax=Pseudoliparis swirei TaxID=2059687 RepID=UPI0024BE0490|nr:synaptic vesicle 2-related protein isoform X2 [Pseudoliparis swirei]